MTHTIYFFVAALQKSDLLKNVFKKNNKNTRVKHSTFLHNF